MLSRVQQAYHSVAITAMQLWPEVEGPHLSNIAVCRDRPAAGAQRRTGGRGSATDQRLSRGQTRTEQVLVLVRGLLQGVVGAGAVLGVIVHDHQRPVLIVDRPDR